MPSGAYAQILFGTPTPLGGTNALCESNSGLYIQAGDDCNLDLGDPAGSGFFPTTLTFGPIAGAHTTFNTDGTATFGVAATFNATTTFTATVSVSSISSPGSEINFNGSALSNIGNPVLPGDATTKAYVDALNAEQDTDIADIESVNATQDTQITTIQSVNTTQQTQIDNLSTVSNNQQTQIDQNTADIHGLQSDVRDLQDRDEELAEGIAISLALDAPLLRTGKTFAMRGGWGNFDGSNAAGVTAAGAISRNAVLDAGVGWGTSQGTVAGKAGVTIDW